MPNLTIGEILTIMVVILIVFGPQRLPEMAKKAGHYLRRARSMVNELRQEFEGEWQDVAQPLKDVRNEIQGVRQDVQSTLTPLRDDLLRAKKEIEEELESASDGTAEDDGDPNTAAADQEDAEEAGS